MIARLSALAVILGCAACQPPPPPTTADAKIKADCRQTVERQYNAQNRADLTLRDERDYAYAGDYNAGITSRGLGAQFQRDQMITDCLHSEGDTSGQPSPGVGPTFSPTQPSGASTLRP